MLDSFLVRETQFLFEVIVERVLVKTYSTQDFVPLDYLIENIDVKW
jgi:hypothetical protein